MTVLSKPMELFKHKCLESCIHLGRPSQTQAVSMSCPALAAGAAAVGRACEVLV